MVATSSTGPARPRARRVSASLGSAIAAAVGPERLHGRGRLRHFGWPQGGITLQAQRMYDLWIGSTIAALVVGVFVWGLIFWCIVRYRKRGDELPAADPVQHADRDALHGRAVADRRGALLLHRDRADRRGQARRTTRTHRRGRRVQVELAVQLPRRHRARTASRSTPSAPSEVHPAAGAADRPDGSGSRRHSEDVIHSFWVPEMLFKRDVFPGNVRQPVRDRHPDRGPLRRPVRGAVRHVPLVHEVRAAWSSRRSGSTQFLAAKQAGRARPDAMASIGFTGDQASRRPPSRSTPTAAKRTAS